MLELYISFQFITFEMNKKSKQYSKVIKNVTVSFKIDRTWASALYYGICAVCKAQLIGMCDTVTQTLIEMHVIGMNLLSR